MKVSLLVLFLYQLLQKHLTLGQVEEMVGTLDEVGGDGGKTLEIAKQLARELIEGEYARIDDLQGKLTEATKEVARLTKRLKDVRHLVS